MRAAVDARAKELERQHGTGTESMAVPLRWIGRACIGAMLLGLGLLIAGVLKETSPLGLLGLGISGVLFLAAAEALERLREIAEALRKK